MNTLMILLTETSDTMTFGTGAGFALIILAIFLGFAILYHGWPKFKK
jgi:hypothetical protein